MMPQQEAHHRDEKKTGLLSSDSLSFTIGARKMSVDSHKQGRLINFLEMTSFGLRPPRIDADSVLNDLSRIIAGGTLQVTTPNLVNTEFEGRRIVTDVVRCPRF